MLPVWTKTFTTARPNLDALVAEYLCTHPHPVGLCFNLQVLLQMADY
jgi:hypothetical protein